jgi:hypothetical protein
VKKDWYVVKALAAMVANLICQFAFVGVEEQAMSSTLVAQAQVEKPASYQGLPDQSHGQRHSAVPQRRFLTDRNI